MRKMLKGTTKEKVVTVRMRADEWALIKADAERRSFTPSAHIRRVMLLVAKGLVIIR